VNEDKVTANYREILSASLQRWSFHTDSSLLGRELSGGLDSANITAIAASICNQRVASYGTVFAGEMGKQQEFRRRELVEKFNTVDYSVGANCIQYYPLSPNGSRLSNLVNYYEEIYSELVEAMLNVAKANGHKVILSGIGGDELLLPDSFTMRNQEEKIAAYRGSIFSNCFFN
jgi:asparagine synthetase B (glutamine-hydrolysing)